MQANSTILPATSRLAARGGVVVKKELQPQELESVHLTEKEIRARYARVSHSTLWRWCVSGTFPKPVRVGPRRTFWRVQDVEAWAAGLEVAPAYKKVAK